MHRLRIYALAMAGLTMAGLSVATAATAGCATAPHLATQMPETVRLTGTSPLTGAWFDGPTESYPHGVLGDAIEATALVAYSRYAISSCGDIRIEAGPDHVFEDVAPRQVDLDHDGRPEVIVVRSNLRKGAQLAVYRDAGNGQLELAATTPYIGQRNRWLAPVGAADLDGDGKMEIAFVDRPHLAKVLRIWRFDQDTLSEVAQMPGVTNHRIGETDIGGGIRNCSGYAEMVLASADWSEVRLVRLMAGKLGSLTWGPYEGRDSFSAALACK